MYPSSAPRGSVDGTRTSSGGGGGGSGALTSPDFFISPTGSSFATGSIADPFSLSFALSGAGGLIGPGETGGLRGGTYVGQFNSTVNGAVGSLVTFRNYNNERATLDANVGLASIQQSILRVSGNYTRIHGLELTNSDTTRVSSQIDTSPTDMNWRSAKEVKNVGHNNEWVHNIIHEAANGMVDQSQDTAWGTIWYGNIAYSIGWIDIAGKGYGHGIYAQNLDPAGKSFLNNIIFACCATGGQFSGSDQAAMLYFTVSGNADFQNGFNGTSTTNRVSFQFEGGTATTLGNSFFRSNHMFNLAGAAVINLNAAGVAPCLPMEFTDNYAHGQVFLNECQAYTSTGNKLTLGVAPTNGIKPYAIRRQNGQSYRLHNSNNNTFGGIASDGPLADSVTGVFGNSYSLPNWQLQTAWDLNSTFNEGNSFPGSDIIYKPSSYEVGRGHVICWNWGLASSLSVDPSQVGLLPGDSYTIHHPYDVFGAPLVSGVYAGGTVSLSQGPYTPPDMTGFSATTPSTGLGYNAFLVRKV